jgi:predicted  nucleic acid-binding Zn-ribbon protein
MKIASFALDGNRGWPGLSLSAMDAGLNVFCGPTGSSKTAVADLIAHALYGRRLAADDRGKIVSPEGEVVVESRGRMYRLRRYQDTSAAERLTVAALDGSAVDHDTVRQLVGGLPPSLLAPLFAAEFRESPGLGWLLSDEFAQEFQAAFGEKGAAEVDDTSEIAARRDAVAAKLESRLARERKKSRELDQQWQEIDEHVHARKQEIEQVRDRLRAAEAELAEVEAWLRYRDFGADSAVHSRESESREWQPRVAELDHEIDRWRATLADLERRQANVQSRIAGTRTVDGAAVISLADQRTWLALARELVADLQGEVARFARANESNLCICGEAHPRLRPIVETLRGHLEALAAITDQQEQGARATDLQAEAEHLARSQAELRGQLEHLLGQRQALARSARPSRMWDHAAAFVVAHAAGHDRKRELWDGGSSNEDATIRRAELAHACAALRERLSGVETELRELRGRRDAIERARAAVLSSLRIKRLQRQLSRLQRELASRSAGLGADFNGSRRGLGDGPRASDFLAQLSDGELVRLEVEAGGPGAQVINRAGAAVSIQSLSRAERDQVYLSLCLSLVTACRRQGVRLPLVLDEPFLRLDRRSITALTAVLDDFGRRGHQVLVFTCDREATARFASLGTARFQMSDLQGAAEEPALAVVRHVARPAAATTGAKPERRERRVRPQAGPKTGADGARRFYLEPITNVVHAPSIGPKTAARLAKIGIHTVADLLAADPVEAAHALAAKSVTPEVVRSWQRQAQLVCQIPQLRQHDAQILVGSGYTRAEQIAEMQPEELLSHVTAFCTTNAGEKILGEHAPPNLALVTKWVSRAGNRRKLDAA